MASSSSDDDDDCHACRICRFQGGHDLPVPTISSLEDLTEQTQALTAKIFKDWVILHKTLKRFEGQIQRRWTKKNNAQRSAILLQAWPGMASTHRPDFAQLRRIGTCNNKHRPNRAKEREAFLWPYINLEDLVQPLYLLIFLNSRGRHAPDKFVYADQQSAHCGQYCGTVDGVDSHTMALLGHRSPKTYGSLVPFDKDSLPGNKADRVKEKLRMNPVDGLLVLQIQERILDFLVKCCRLILHDVDFETLDLMESKSAPSQLKLNMLMPTVTALASIAPYRLPQTLDLDRLGMLVAARREDAEEHIWALREDPGYFAQIMKDWAEHQPEMIPDKFKRQHESVGEPEFWAKVATEMIFHAYSSLIIFADMGTAIIQAREKLDGCRHLLRSSTSLSPGAEKAFARLDRLVDTLKHEPLHYLMEGFAASPPLRHGYERKASVPRPPFHHVDIKMGRRSPAWRVHILFRTLLSHDQQKKHGLANTAEEIQRMLDERSKDSDLITNWVADRFSDLALMAEIERQLHLFRPWSTSWRCGTYPYAEEDEKTYEMVSCLHEVFNCANLDHANPANFVYPSEKRRSRETVTKMRLAEQRLDKFWDGVEEAFECHTGFTLNYALMEVFEDWNRRLQRTEPWIEPRDNKKARQDGSSGQETRNLDDAVPLYQLDPNARCSHPTKSEILEGVASQKIKQKTRPANVSGSRPENRRRDSATEVEQKRNIAKIVVNKRTYKVFSTLFHVPSAKEQQNQGEVAWSEFLYAMNQVGFSVEKLYGSSWQFTPTEIDVGRSIQIHEPHPHAKMHFWLAKRVGRRLNRAFGWDGETFFLK